jgi:glycosyltransferase involved in cell wall biosynthesis
MRPRRVLFIAHRAELAGAEIALLNFVAHLNRRKFIPSVLLPYEGAISSLLTKHQIPYYCAPYYQIMMESAWDSPAHLKSIRPLREAIIALSPDIIVVNTNTIPHAIIAALTTSIPLMVHLHAFVTRQQYTSLSDRIRAADELWLQFADKIIACSAHIASRYEELLKRFVNVIPNTTPSVKATTVPNVQPAQFVMLATFEAHKRADLFILASAQIQREHPDIDFECHLYGDGNLREQENLQRLITQHKLEMRFKLHQPTGDTDSIYQNATCVIVPSDIEPFSMVSIEAAAHARPVIATRSGGPDDIIIDGKTGILIKVNDVEMLAACMLELMRYPDRAAQMGRAAQTRFATHYAPGVVVPNYEALLEEMCVTPFDERRRLAQIVARYFMSSH